MLSFQGRKRVSLSIDMAPLIDVVFLLLVFFMLTSTMNSQKAIDFALPSSESAVPTEKKPLSIEVPDAGTILVSGKSVPLDELTAALAPIFSSSTQREVSLKSEKSVPIQTIVSVMDAIKSAGGELVSLETEKQAP